MQQLNLFGDASNPQTFQSEEGLDKFESFPAELWVKCAEGQALNPTASTYKELPLYIGLKEQYPKLLIAVTAQEVCLQLRVGVWASYDFTDEAAPQFVRDFMRGNKTREHWVRLKLKRQESKL